jgi:tRNA pseudouridine38-40 synthase
LWKKAFQKDGLSPLNPAKGFFLLYNYKITVSYDGRDFSGWQRQENGIAVQEVLEEAIGKVLGHKVTIFGSGRTDAGVHALGQVASFLSASYRTPTQLIRGCNSLLPDSIALIEAEFAPEDFHARFSATGKKYSYDYLISPMRLPLIHWRAWWVGDKLHWDKCKRCLVHLVGEKDFSTFRSTGSPTKSNVRRIFSATLTPIEPYVMRLELVGSGFLRHMARAIAGSIYEVGRRRIDPFDFPAIIAKGDRKLAGLAAPAKGLCLREVYYHPLSESIL